MTEKFTILDKSTIVKWHFIRFTPQSSVRTVVVQHKNGNWYQEGISYPIKYCPLCGTHLAELSDPETYCSG